MGSLSLLLLVALLLMGVDLAEASRHRQRGGRSRRDRRRRRRTRTKPAKCTSAEAYNMMVMKYKKGSEADMPDVGPENADMECMKACIKNSNAWLYFVLTIPEDENAKSGCKCTKGKIKKVKPANYKFATGGLDVDASAFLMKKGSKMITADDKPCRNTPNATPHHSKTKLFEVMSGFATDPVMLWNGNTNQVPAEAFYRSDELDDFAAMEYDEFKVSVMKDDAEQSFFTFANAGGKAGFFTQDNLVATSYSDLLDAEMEFFQVEAYDTPDGGHDMNLPSWQYKNWEGEPTWSDWFSEEKGGFSNPRRAWPIVGMQCSGGYCDNKRLRWTQTYGDILDLSKEEAVRQISEENGNGAYNMMECNSGYGVENSLVSRIKCTGDNCDNMLVYCAPLKEGWKVNTSDKATTNWFSDDYRSVTDCGRDRYVAGMYCKGSYCDDVNMICLKIQRWDSSIGREWYIANHAGCENDNGWLALDSGKENYDYDGCDWEHSEKLEIFYAPNGKKATWLTEAGRADSLVVTGMKYTTEWNFAFKIATEGSEVDAWDFWQNGGSYGLGEEFAMDPASPASHFRHPILDTFFRRNEAGRVRFVLYSDGKPVKKIEWIVNAGDPQAHSWMTLSNLVKSDWAGIKIGMTSNYFSVAGDYNGQRNFFIQHNYDGCNVDSGWLVVQGKTRNEMCPWEQNQDQPFIMYSAGDENQTWEQANGQPDGAEADSIAVFLSFDSKLGYVRMPKKCVNGENIKLYESKTVKECATLCDETDGCVGFEYGINYGGQTYKNYDCQLSSSANLDGCDGAAMNLDFYMPTAADEEEAD